MNKKTYLVKQSIMVLVAFMLLSAAATAQTAISGTVTDSETNEPLVGAYIFPVGGKGGAITDDKGAFTLSVTKGVTAIKVSFVGYGDQTLSLGNQTKFNIKLVSDDKLDEVLVIAYGTQKKSDKTGAVTQVTAEELNKGRITDPIQGMQGKAAGVNISKQGGDPNAGFSVNIRGSASITGGSGPLYVVDGVIGVDITTINPDDIATFNILKDAASTSLYGTQGSNGVIIITTKGGSFGGQTSDLIRLEYNNFVAFDRVANRLDFLSGDELRDYATTTGNANFQDNGANIDWMDAIYRTGVSQQHTVAVSKSDENTNYRLSLSTNSLTGVLKGSDKTRNIARFNLAQKALDDKLTISARLSATLETNNYVKYDGGSDPKNVIYQAMRRSPTDPIYNPDGSFFETDRNFQYNNPVAMIEQFTNTRDAKRYLANVDLSYEITENLQARVTGALGRDDQQSWYAEPASAFSNNTGGLANREYKNKSYNYISEILSYSKTFNEVHSLNVLGGHSWQSEYEEGFRAEVRDIDPFYEDVGADNLKAYSTINWGNSTSFKNTPIGLASYFSRAIYDFDKKYYATLSLRRDKSTKYGDAVEWGTFWAASTAWNIKKESFMKDITAVSDLRLRVGYGLTGNADIPNNIDRVRYEPTSKGIDSETGQEIIIWNNNTGNIANPDLAWEEVREVNIGLDFGLFKNRIMGSLELYSKTTDGLVMEVAVPVPPNIAPKKFENAGEIKNTGAELTLSGVIVDNKNFKWKSTLAASTNKQETVTLGNLEANSLGIKKLYVSGRGLVGGDNYTQVILPGYEVGTFFLPVFKGFSGDGKFLFETEAGGVTRDVTKAQRQFVGSAQPDVIVGWSHYFQISKGFDASFSLRGIFGHQIFNVTKMVFSNPADAPNQNVLASAIEGTNANITSDPTISTFYLEDGDFVKLDNISFGYNIPFKRESKIRNLRVFLTGNNVWMWTKYSGLDPELNFSGTEFGRDQYDVYPRTQSFSIGINSTF
ncbi:MAG: SusC/RagA family TonB-linked outer membrane protein [Bacteroidetes bacterium]|jgi:TonB-dependent starch-binding outer membrane protein SusC|nr:SusC/RagA family TonB-linked outer membrane protein [Bacteroidota bacterium]